MRDVLLTLVLIGTMPIAFKRPVIGALVFAVVSLANPHRMTWTFAYSMPWAMAFAVLTIAGLTATKDRLVANSVRRYLPVLIYLAWMGITTFFALERGQATPRLVEVTKIHTMCLVTLCLLTEWKWVKALVWVITCSVGFYGLKGGIFTLTSGGGYLVWGPMDSAIEDNNHLAVGLVMMLPLMYWVFTEAKRRWVRWLVLAAALMSAVSIFGSHSRSAFLAIVAMSFFLLLKSRHKFTVALIAGICAVVAITFMPQQYWDRMASIQTYEQDASAMGRINVWKTAINIANDRPTGAGFEYYTPPVFKRYSPDPNDVHSSHSIYFQALGEHGWVGLGLFLLILGYIWMKCRMVVKHASDSVEGRSQALLARMIQVTLIGFAVGGAFVNIGNWDMIYYLAIAALATARLCERQLQADAQTAAEADRRTQRLTFPRTRQFGRQTSS